MTEAETKRPEDQRKIRLKRLARLVDGFLERPIDKEDLDSNPEEIKELIKLLERDLWGKRMYGSGDPNVDILLLHHFLQVFWDKFKADIFNIKHTKNNNFKPEVTTYRTVVEVNMEINFVLGDVIYFYDSIGDAVRALMDLLHGLPINVFEYCQDKKCNRVFILTSRHEREYCSQKCAARAHQRRKRETDPEGYRKYHKEYYRRKILGESET